MAQHQLIQFSTRRSILRGILSTFLLASKSSSFNLPSLLQNTVQLRRVESEASNYINRAISNINDQRSPLTIIQSSRSGGGENESEEGKNEDGVPPSIQSSAERIEECKIDLIRMCEDHELGSGTSLDINDKIQDLEILGEDVGFGQASSLSGLLSGEWELIYASDDITRSSPFFWAFRRAFPDSSDQIFGITDAIPSPIKMLGPATQTIETDSTARPVSGTLVSRVKVATLGGVANSIMTTRCTVLGADGLDGLRLRVESTKPEDSTILEKLGPLGELVNSSSPPFPSGEALERVAPGSSEVVMRTTYCDEGIRISRNEDRMEKDVFVWRRTKFGNGNLLSV